MCTVKFNAKWFCVFAVVISLFFSYVSVFAEDGFITLLSIEELPERLYKLQYASLDEVVESLPQYVNITTSPPKEYNTLPVEWEHIPIWEDGFSSSPGAFNLFNWEIIIPEYMENPSFLRRSGNTSVYNAFSEIDMVAQMSYDMLNRLPVSNRTTADDIMAAVEYIIKDYPLITAEWHFDGWTPPFSLTPATLTSNGNIIGRIRLNMEEAEEFQDIHLWLVIRHPIPQRLYDVRAAVESLNVSNLTTSNDFIAAVEAIVSDTEIEVTLHGDFNLTHATQNQDGKITGTIRLAVDADYVDIEINRTIAYLREWNIVLMSVARRASLLSVSNQTTVTDIITHMETPLIKHGLEFSWHDDFSLTPATETQNGRITLTATLTYGEEQEPYTFIFEREIPRSRVATETFLQWDYGTLAAPRPNNIWTATSGEVPLSETNLQFMYADGVQAILGRQQADRLAINAPNRSATEHGVTEELYDWYIPDMLEDRPPWSIDSAAGWVITLNTQGWENINFSARQGSSNNGPGGFGLAYKIGTDGDWTACGDGSWSLVSVRTNYPRDTVLGVTFNNVQLPHETANQPIVQIKLYITGEVRLGGDYLRSSEGNTSINNIVFRGEKTENSNDFRIGDINNDGRITSADSTLLARYLAQQVTVNPRAADINGDGKISTDDITLLARWLIAGQDAHLAPHSNALTKT